jgi:peroxiredoxin
MKRLIYILLACLSLTACKEKKEFVIKGKFENPGADNKVYLFSLDRQNQVPLDSTVLSDKGEFKFTHATPAVDFFRIAAGNKEYMIIAQNGDEIELTADLLNESMTYNISGAAEADKLAELNTTKNQYMGRISALQKEFEEQSEAQPEKRSEILEQMRPRYTAEIDGLNKAVLSFANKNANSLAGFYAINLLNPAEFEKELVDYSDKIKDNFKENVSVKEFVEKMARLKAIQVGQPAPDFTINSIDNTPIKLSDYKGKYVLLDFWASWCQPCRQENPNLVRAYNAFKDKNFHILGVSLDKDPAAWKSAIAADGLSWSHASELKDFEGESVRLYQVEAIPSSFIIDPNGVIVAKNLRGEELDNFLAKTLKLKEN